MMLSVLVKIVAMSKGIQLIHVLWTKVVHFVTFVAAYFKLKQIRK